MAWEGVDRVLGLQPMETHMEYCLYELADIVSNSLALFFANQTVPAWVKLDASASSMSAIATTVLAYLTRQTLKEIKIQKDLSFLPHIVISDIYPNIELTDYEKHENIIYMYRCTLRDIICDIEIFNCGGGSAKKINIEYKFNFHEFSKSIDTQKDKIFGSVGYNEKMDTLIIASTRTNEGCSHEYINKKNTSIQCIIANGSKENISFPKWYVFLAILHKKYHGCMSSFPQLNAEITYYDTSNVLRKTHCNFTVDENLCSNAPHYAKFTIKASA